MPACLELEAAFREAWADPALPRRARRPAARLRRPPVAAHRVPAPVRASSACGCCSSARTSTTPARTRSTTSSARRCSPSAWASTRLVAETGAGQHGVATATAAALFGHRVRRLHGRGRRRAPGAQRVPHAAARRRGATRSTSGSRTLKDAINEAMRDWVATVETTHYCLGSVMGPHPYPWMVREFQRVIGDEARAQCRGAARRRRSRRRRRLRRRRLERGGHLLRLRRHRRRARRASSRPAARPSATACPAWCTA